jgi:murein DD-endopeptidase MepM/ murein hydrolase activator NlpD
MNLRIWLFVSLSILMTFILTPLSYTGERSPTGFYYPFKDDDPNFTGKWLMKPPQYPFSNVYHIGVDMSASINTSVYAIADGTIKTPSDRGWGDGNIAVIIEHKTSDGGTFRAIYGHIKSNSASEPGSVKAGDKIGEIGNWSGGSHIHFGILYPGLSAPVGSESYGMKPISQYGVTSNGYYDNGLIDPIWFITHNVPDNWISRQEVNPGNPITTEDPWFSELCVNSYDARCDGSSMTAYEACVLEGSTLCAPAVSSYSAVNSGGSNSSGGIGGDYTYADFIVNNIWLEDQNENTKNVFRPGQLIQMKAQFKNIGDDSPFAIEVKFYLSNGEQVDPNKQQVGSDTIQASNMESGETHTETESIYAPTTPGTYNITACADTGDDVVEEHESNNCSDEAVFRVEDYAWLMPILNLLLQ